MIRIGRCGHVAAKAQLKDEDDNKDKDKVDEDIPRRTEEGLLRPQHGGNIWLQSLSIIRALFRMSKTVREITIRLYGLPPVQAPLQLLQKRQLLGLEALDEAITRDAFRRLRSVHRRMRFRSTCRPMLNTDWQKIESVVQSKTHPNVQSKGLLDFGLQHGARHGCLY